MKLEANPAWHRLRPRREATHERTTKLRPAMKLPPLILAGILFLLYLWFEQARLRRRRAAIPLCLSVTGTRGKSSVVRMIAAVLREHGRKVIAKTTGSQALYILPDAREAEIPRQGIVSIIEQKKLIKKAAEFKVEVVVVEIMSIHPENHYVESQQLLRPDIVVITNIRQDHTEAMGATREEIASVFCLDIPARACVFVPARESSARIAAAVRKAGGELHEVPEEAATPLYRLAPELQRREFTENLALVCAVGEYLHIDPVTILNGVRNARHDSGRLQIWKYRSQEHQKTCYLVNGFAANDPDSTLQVVAKVRDLLPAAGSRLTGLLSLRSDRADRTRQWLEALRNDKFGCFGRVYVTGTHAGIFQRRLKSVRALRRQTPERLMHAILAEAQDQAVIFGCGNMKGVGEDLVTYWQRIGEAHDL